MSRSRRGRGRRRRRRRKELAYVAFVKKYGPPTAELLKKGAIKAGRAAKRGARATATGAKKTKTLLSEFRRRGVRPTLRSYKRAWEIRREFPEPPSD